jgi:GNAT superfamily N-acetyltransferase
VPRPGRFSGHNRYGYVTNVYAEPEVRGQGIGSRLLERVVEWAREQGLQFLIVWPSEESVRFYERGGFRASPDALELQLDEGNGSPSGLTAEASGYGEVSLGSQ